MRLLSNYISENAKLNNNINMENSVGIFIGDDVEINNNVSIGNFVTIKKAKKTDEKIVIGNNVEIKPHAVVTESVEDNSVVDIVTQLQVTTKQNLNYINSQKLFVYGVIPKFKNHLIIVGEGFYNPTVLIKIKNLNTTLNYQINYWDKNKIIIKFKNQKPLNSKLIENNKIIILCNSNKIIILNNFALIKTLSNLSK